MIYLIGETRFDNYENHFPWYTELVGFSTDKVKTEDKVKELDKQEKYKGWDGKFYPQYKVIEVNEI